VIRTILLGIWIATVTCGATLVAAKYFADAGRPVSDMAVAEAGDSAEEIKTDILSIPVVRNGDIMGYVIVQLSFVADKTRLEKLKMSPAPYLVDAALRTIYANPEIDSRRLSHKDLSALTDAIRIEANSRVGSEIIRQVLIQQLNFVRKDEIRTNWIGARPVESSGSRAH